MQKGAELYRGKAKTVYATDDAHHLIMHYRDDVSAFVGAWLTEPKAHVFFAPPSRVPGIGAFAKALARRGARLDLRTQALYDARAMYVNGELVTIPAAARAALRRFADRRVLPAREAASLDANAHSLLHDWYRHGWLHLGTA